MHRHQICILPNIIGCQFLKVVFYGYKKNHEWKRFNPRIKPKKSI
jgi:hypothetical protein